MTTISQQADVDGQAVEEFAGQLFELFTGGALTYLIDIGQRTGLFDAALTAAGRRRVPSWRLTPGSRSATCGSGWGR